MRLFGSRRASRAYLASRVFLPMDFGYSVGIVLASLCASAVGDSARGICCSGDSWDMARRGDRGDFSRRRRRFPTNAGGLEKRALGWGPGRLAGTPRGSGDAREAKASATEARGTKGPSASGCGEWPASLAAAPSCHERRFFGERDHPRSCEKNVASILPGLGKKTTRRRGRCRRDLRPLRHSPGHLPHLVNARRRTSAPAPLLESDDVTMTRGRA